MLQTPIDQPGQEQTLQGLLSEMAEVERRVVKEAKLESPIPRLEIVSRLRAATLAETEAVARWIELYSSLTRWLKCDIPPLPLPHSGSKKSEKAASGGLFFAHA